MKNAVHKLKESKYQFHNFKVIDINKKREKIRRIHRFRLIVVCSLSCFFGAFVMFVFNFLVVEALMSQMNSKICRINDEINEIQNINSNKKITSEKFVPSEFYSNQIPKEDKVEINSN